jgi:hypothetical protein
LPTILPCALLREVVYNVAQLSIARYTSDQLLFHAAPAAAAASSGGGSSSTMMSSSSKAAASRALVRSLGDMLSVSPNLRAFPFFVAIFLFEFALQVSSIMGSSPQRFGDDNKNRT